MKDLVLFGDCRKTLPAFIDEARMCVTSPPYYGLRDYGGEASQIGMEQSPEEYIQQFLTDIRDIMTYAESSEFIDERTAQTENIYITLP